MKCMYYLAPTLQDTHRISDDLHDAGVNDWFLHIVSKDEAGLKREKLHSSNYLETLDLIRDGFIGANIGFIIGVIGAALLMYYQPFGPDVPLFVYLIVIALATKAIMNAAAEKFVRRMAYPITPNNKANPTSQIEARDE